MAGIPSSEASEEGDKGCQKQVQKGSNPPAAEKQAVNENGECFSNVCQINVARSADISKNRLQFCIISMNKFQRREH